MVPLWSLGLASGRRPHGTPDECFFVCHFGEEFGKDLCSFTFRRFWNSPGKPSGSGLLFVEVLWLQTRCSLVIDQLRLFLFFCHFR